MKKKLVFLFLLIVCKSIIINAQPTYQIYPTHWFVGFKNKALQIILHQQNIKNEIEKIVIHYPGVSLQKFDTVESNNYLFIDLKIASQTKAGIIKLMLLKKNGNTQIINYLLKEKNKEDEHLRVQGITSADFIYLLLPDRFSNGDPKNDFFYDMNDTGHNRLNPFDRHGGDLIGIQNHLDYLKNLGVTSLWLTPVLENDMHPTLEGSTYRSTYHGYAITNQYSVDKRFGGNDAYKNLIDAAHQKGLKIIQDAVYNHIGNDHWSVKDLPMKSWLNQWPNYTQTTYRYHPFYDTHASEYDKNNSEKGWFTTFMPDLNQGNPYVSTFLIQYAIWATEEFGIDGWRVDTYFYSNPAFLNKINTALENEFSTITVFGETSVNNPASGAYYCNNNLDVPFKHNLQGITDYPFCYAAWAALTQPADWDNGVNFLYETLSQDFLYKNPMKNCIFLDNHDQNRIFSTVGEDFEKYKMAIGLLLTQRGIPQMYYGTEILMKNFMNPSDAEVRKDFPGGWDNDTVNKFLASNRTSLENEAFNYVKKLAWYRQSSSALTQGKLMQFLPEKGCYVYFRYTQTQTIMCILNTEKEINLNMNRFKEIIQPFKQIKNVLTGSEFQKPESLQIASKSFTVLELK